MKAISTTTLSTPIGTYIYDVTRASPHALAAICSDDSLRWASRSTLALTGCIPATHHLGVTCLSSLSDTTVLTGGRDGTISIYDERTYSRTTTLRAGGSAAILSVASTSTAIAAGTEHVPGGTSAKVIVWDVRSPYDVLAEYTESHNDDVTAVRFHPRLPHLLVSAGADSLVSVYDLRRKPATGGEATDDDAALWRIVNHGYPVRCAGFLGEGGEEMYALSHDEVLAVYELNDAGAEETRGFGNVRDVLGCEYVIDVVRKGAEAVVAVGSKGEGEGEVDRQWVDLVLLKTDESGVRGWALAREKVRLEGGHGEDVVRGVFIDHEVSPLPTPWVVCTSDLGRRGRYLLLGRMGWSRCGEKIVGLWEKLGASRAGRRGRGRRRGAVLDTNLTRLAGLYQELHLASAVVGAW